jgi:hypothetical protein
MAHTTLLLLLLLLMMMIVGDYFSAPYENRRGHGF